MIPLKQRKLTILPNRIDAMLADIPDKRMQMFVRISVFVLFIGLIFMFCPVYASVGSMFGYPDDIKGVYEAVLSGKTAKKTLGMCFGTSVFGEIMSSDVVKNVLTFTSGVGLVLVLIHTLLLIIKSADEGTLNRGKVLKIMITLLVPMFFILNMSLLTDGIQYVGSWVKDSIIREVYHVAPGDYEPGYLEEYVVDKADATENADKMYSHVRKLLGYKDTGLEFEYDGDESWIVETFRDAGNFVIELILIGVDIGISIGIMVACYGVLGRLIIYQAFLPIGIADLGKDGLRSNGTRAIKRYFGVYLEIAMFYLITAIGWEIFNILAIKQDTVSGLVICFIGAGIGIRAVMRSARRVSDRLVNV